MTPKTMSYCVRLKLNYETIRKHVSVTKVKPERLDKLLIWMTES